MNMKSKLLETWENDPPTFYYITHPIPSAPSVRLDGGGCGNYDANVFIEEVEKTIARKQGLLWDTQPYGDSDHDWFLIGYEALDHPVYQKFIILYYEPSGTCEQVRIDI